MKFILLRSRHPASCALACRGSLAASFRPAGLAGARNCNERCHVVGLGMGRTGGSHEAL
jgi:hypothetical protein